MQGDKHVEVNGGLLQALQLIYPDDEFFINADNRHYNNIIGKLAKVNNVHCYNNFKYNPKEDSKRNIVFKIIRQSILAHKIFKEAKKREVRFIIFTSAFPFVAIFLNYLAKRFKQKIIVCQHGDLGVLLLDKNRITTRVFRYVIKYFLFHRNLQYNTFLFYGKSIENRLINTYPQFSNENVISIDHPYQYDNCRGRHLSNKSPTIIAHIGMALISKQSHLLFDLAKKINNNKIKFIQIGSLASEIQPYINEYVDILAPNVDFVPPQVFDEALEKSDYFIYFFKKDSYYDLCPSGTFFDAIKYETPIISLRNDFFEYYFNKLGNIGYLCDSFEEIVTLVEDISNNKRVDEFSKQVNNLRQAKQKLSINEIAVALKTQILDNGLDGG
jgi:hypothetical protein